VDHLTWLSSTRRMSHSHRNAQKAEKKHFQFKCVSSLQPPNAGKEQYQIKSTAKKLENPSSSV